jgi:hypothetical protein
MKLAVELEIFFTQTCGKQATFHVEGLNFGVGLTLEERA